MPLPLHLRFSELTLVAHLPQNLLAERERMQAEVASLEATKADLAAQLEVDAAENARQVAKIKELTVRHPEIHELPSIREGGGTPCGRAQPLRHCPCPVTLTPLPSCQDIAAADTEELDALEAQCNELSEELKDKEKALRTVQEMERKCSREFIAYEKAKAKGARAKEVERKDFKKFG